MKVYLVSKVKCWSDELSCKEFECFSNKEEAMAYKEKLVDLYICHLCDYWDLEYNSLDLLEDQYITVIHNGANLFIALSFDGTEEVQIELTELDLQ